MFNSSVQAPFMEKVNLFFMILQYIPGSSKKEEVLVPRWSAGATGWIPTPPSGSVSGESVGLRGVSEVLGL